MSISSVIPVICQLAARPLARQLPPVTVPLARRAFATNPSAASATSAPSSNPEAHLQSKISKRLQQAELTAQQRNTFQQLTLPHVRLESSSHCGRHCTFLVEVCQSMCHYSGTIHAGMIAGLIFDTTTLQATAVDQQSRKVLAISSSFDFQRGAKVGEDLMLISDLVLLGKNLVCADVRLRNPDQEIVATGKHWMKFEEESDHADGPSGMMFV